MALCCKVSAPFISLTENGKQSRSVALDPIRRHLLAHGRDYFPSLERHLRVTITPVRQPSTNPLYRFIVSDDCRTFPVIAKWAPIYPDNNEGETEYLHYRNFYFRYGSDSPFRCPKPVAFLRR